MNGKGDKLRKGANLQAYYDNYDKIFRKQDACRDQNEVRSSEEKHNTLKLKKKWTVKIAPLQHKNLLWIL